MPRYRFYRRYKDKNNKTYILIDGNKIYVDSDK